MALWISDGTPAGTFKLADSEYISPGQTNDGKHFFLSSEDNSVTLWMTDGTATGTVKLITSSYLKLLTFEGEDPFVAGVDPNTGNVGFFRVNADGQVLGFVAADEGTANMVPLAVNLVGTGAADLLRGGIDADRLSGNAGDDVLEGRAGDDILDGGSGNDVLDGGAGDDKLDGGLGNDTASYASATAGVTVFLTTATAQNTIGAGRDTLVSFENLAGSDFDDILAGDDNANILRGSKGADTLIGGGGDDTLEGGPGDDSLNGGLGSDTADYFAAGGAVRINLLFTTSQDTGAAGLDKLVSVENLVGTPFADTLIGNVSANTLLGGDGADSLYGWSGDDTLYGEAGDDLIIGDAGNDTVDGGAGNDRLYGGSGNDFLFGGTGADVVAGGPAVDRVDGGDGADRLFADTTADTFVFGGRSGAGDRIFGFRSGVHILEINAVGFGGTADTFAFVANGTPNPNSCVQTFLYDIDDGKLLFDPDGTGPAPRVYVGQLFAPNGLAATLSATDLELL